MTDLMIPGNNPLMMSSREIAALTGKQHQHVKRDIEKMLVELSEDASNFGRIYLDSMNREQTEYLLDKELTETLLTGYSAALRRRVIRRWRELEGGAQPFTPTAANPEKLVGELAILECCTRILNPAPSARIAMLKKVGEKHELDVSFLPGYAIDAAPDAAVGGSMPTASLTALLKQHDIKLTASVYNTILRDIGILELRTRKTSKGEDKHFWLITEKGQRFGKNLTSPASPRETQPHWYTERFDELHSLVTDSMGRVA